MPADERRINTRGIRVSSKSINKYQKLLFEGIPGNLIIKNKKKGRRGLSYINAGEDLRSYWMIKQIFREHNKYIIKKKKIFKLEHRRKRRAEKKEYRLQLKKLKIQRALIDEMQENEEYWCCETGIKLNEEDIFCLNYAEILRSMRKTVEQINNLNRFIEKNCEDFSVRTDCTSLVYDEEAELVVSGDVAQAFNAIMQGEYFVSYIKRKGEMYQRLKLLKEVKK